jgi:hypothetical protein
MLRRTALSLQTLAVLAALTARAVAGENKDPFGEAETLNGLGEVHLADSRPGQARTAHSRALGMYGQAGDKFERARAHAGLARSEQPASDPARALDHWHQALAMYTELGTPEVDQIRAQLSVGNDGRQTSTTSAQDSFDP